RGGPEEPRSTFGVRGGDESGTDPAQGDGQGRLLPLGLGERAPALPQPPAQVGVGGVDLAGTFGSHGDQAVLAVDAVQQLVDRRIGDAFGDGLGTSHFAYLQRRFPARRKAARRKTGTRTAPGPRGRSRYHTLGAVINASSSEHTSRTDVLTRVASNSFS